MSSRRFPVQVQLAEFRKLLWLFGLLAGRLTSEAVLPERGANRPRKYADGGQPKKVFFRSY